jgi:hypothetical protein
MLQLQITMAGDATSTYTHLAMPNFGRRPAPGVLALLTSSMQPSRTQWGMRAPFKTRLSLCLWPLKVGIRYVQQSQLAMATRATYALAPTDVLPSH